MNTSDSQPYASTPSTFTPTPAYRIDPAPWPPYDYPVPITPAPAGKPRRGALLIAGLLAVLLIGAGIGAYLLFVRPGTAATAGLTEQTAQRACRTAVQTEWDRRNGLVTGGDVEIVSTVQGIDLQETWKTADGYNVNAVVRYTLTTAFIDPVNDTLNLTCLATGTDGNVSTTVANR